MTVTAEIRAGQWAELVKQVQAGNEVLLTHDSKPVAKLIATGKEEASDGTPFEIRSFKGHQVLTPQIRQEELAEDLFSRE
jgi:antitoxin (DNA-binding transcriptional repressor) of toxin-antitoxin stability system